MAKDTYQGIARYRIIGGKKYEYYSKHKTKSDAQRAARFLRGRGDNVRVIPIPKTSAVSHPDVKWLVYSVTPKRVTSIYGR